MIHDELQQILQNWCLVRYSTLCGENNNRERWEAELLTHIVSVASNKIKQNNSYKNRYKATREVWVKKECDRDINVVHLLVFPIFIAEGIDYNNTYYKQSIENCMNASAEIIRIIAEANEDSIKQYIENI